MQRILLAIVVLFGLAGSVKAGYFSATGQVLDPDEGQIVGWNADIDNGTAETINDNGSIIWPTASDTLAVVSSSAKDLGGTYATGTFTVVDYDQMLGEKATGTLTINTNGLTNLNGFTLTINGINLYAGTSFNVNGDQSLSMIASSLVTIINANGHLANLLTATSSANVVTLTADANGETANAIALTLDRNGATINGITASASTLLGGEDLLTITINGRTFVAGVAFTPTTSNADTAEAIVDMINDNGHLASLLTASSSGRVVTLTANAVGTTANSITTSSNDSDSLTAGAATLTHGKANQTGALTVSLIGLDANYDTLTETVILNGTTAVNTTGRFLRLNSAEVATAGTNGDNIGNISIRHNGLSMVAKILANNNKAFPGVYTVPNGKTIYITDCYSGFKNSGTGGLSIELQSRPLDGVFSSDLIKTVESDGNSDCNSTLQTPLSIPAKSDIKLKGTSSVTNASIFAGFRFVEL